VHKHIHNINPKITVIAGGGVDEIGRRLGYSINLLGDEVREPTEDGSVITRRPVQEKISVDFSQLNEEALLSIVEDRLADRCAGDYGNRRTQVALRSIRKALDAVRRDSVTPMRRRSATHEPVVVDDDDVASPAPLPVSAVDPANDPNAID
jgi:hypothetical protein